VPFVELRDLLVQEFRLKLSSAAAELTLNTVVRDIVDLLVEPLKECADDTIVALDYLVETAIAHEERDASP
jgi:hypothetical protein